MTTKQEPMEGVRSASPDNMNALETSDTSDSGPTVEEKRGEARKGSKVVSLADGPEGQGDEREAYPPRRRSKQGTRDTQRSENPSLARRITDLFVSERPVKHEPTWRASALAIVKASWLNVLLVFIPVGWALSYSHVNDTLVFIFKLSLAFSFRSLGRIVSTRLVADSILDSSLLVLVASSVCSQLPITRGGSSSDTFFLNAAIIPLAKLLGFGTEEIALRVGQALGGRKCSQDTYFAARANFLSTCFSVAIPPFSSFFHRFLHTRSTQRDAR